MTLASAATTSPATAVVARALERAVRTPDCVLDGEVCALDEEGRSSFSVMQQGSGPFVYYVFDVLEIDGEPVLDLPLRERRERLAGLLDLEGTRFGSPRPSTTAWRSWPPPRPRDSRGSGQESRLSLPAWQADPRLAEGQDAPGAGVRRRRLHQGKGTQGADTRLARPRRHARRPARVRGQRRHRVHRGRDRATPAQAPTARAGDLRVSRGSEDAEGAKGRRRLGRAGLVAEVEFAEWTHDGRLRAPVYRGLREDKESRRGVERSRFRPRSSAEDARCASPTSTSRSGRRRASRRAT